MATASFSTGLCPLSAFAVAAEAKVPLLTKSKIPATMLSTTVLGMASTAGCFAEQSRVEASHTLLNGAVALLVQHGEALVQHWKRSSVLSQNPSSTFTSAFGARCPFMSFLLEMRCAPTTPSPF